MPAPILACARCGRRFRKGEDYVYSRFTRNRYCIQLDACKARTLKRRKAAAK